MDTSSNDAIRFASDQNHSEGSSGNWYVFLFAVIITLFVVYWGFVRPTSRQLTKMRRYVTSLESSIAELNGQRAGNEATLSLLDQLVQQGHMTNRAGRALNEVRALHDQVIHEAGQLRSAREALQNLAAMRTELARQSSLIEATQRALESIETLHHDVHRTAGETEEARAAVEKLSVVRDGLVESVEQLDGVRPLLNNIDELHTRLAASSARAETAQGALDGLITLGDQIEAQAVTIDKAETVLSSMVHLQDRVLAQSDSTAMAIETMELATDVQIEMRRAGKTFTDMKQLLAEMSLMQPQLHQAIDCLQPLATLTDLRRLGTEDMRRVVSVVRERYLAASNTIKQTEIVAEAIDMTEVE